MSTITTSGISAQRIYDEASASIDMEPYMARFETVSSTVGVARKAKNGYLVLTVSSIAWTSSASALDVTDNIYLDFEIAGFTPLTHTQIKDTSNVALLNYKINSVSGSITFSGSNVAKYVWTVTDGVPDGVSLNDDNTFTAFRVRSTIQQNNLLTAAEEMTFTVTYTLSFVDLETSTIVIGALSSPSNLTLSVDEAQPIDMKYVTSSAYATTDSGVIVLQLGSVTTTADNSRPLSNTFMPSVNDEAPMYHVDVPSGVVLHNQTTARHTRTKELSGTTPRFMLFAVNQGKIGQHGRLINAHYHLARFTLSQGNSDDGATVSQDYKLTVVTV